MKTRASQRIQSERCKGRALLVDSIPSIYKATDSILHLDNKAQKVVRCVLWYLVMVKHTCQGIKGRALTYFLNASTVRRLCRHSFSKLCIQLHTGRHAHIYIYIQIMALCLKYLNIFINIYINITLSNLMKVSFQFYPVVQHILSFLPILR